MPDLTDLLERSWASLSRWAVPVMMSLAYALLAATSDTNATGKLWMAAGFGLVMIAWFTFRSLADSGALARALVVGDVPRLLALSDRGLARRGSAGRRGSAARARLLIARALAHFLRGDPAASLAALDDFAHVGPTSTLPPDLAALAVALRTLALVELDRPPPAPSDAATAPSSPSAAPSPWLTRLADGALAWRANRLDVAASNLSLVIDHMRAGSAIRAIAHVYAARVAAARGDTTASARHRTSATDRADPAAAWLRGDSSTV